MDLSSEKRQRHRVVASLNIFEIVINISYNLSNLKQRDGKERKGGAISRMKKEDNSKISRQPVLET